MPSSSDSAPDTAQDGVDAGDHLDQRERFGDVVVAAHGEPGDLVVEAVARGQEEHRHPQAVAAEAAGHLEPVEVGQHHVEHDEVGGPLLGRLQRVASVAGLLDVEALVAERGGHGVHDRRLVVDHQDPLLSCRDGHRCLLTQKVAIVCSPGVVRPLCGTCEIAQRGRPAWAGWVASERGR